MNITLNNSSVPYSQINFTDNYNILKVIDSSGGTKSTITIVVAPMISPTTDGEVSVSINVLYYPQHWFKMQGVGTFISSQIVQHLLPCRLQRL